LYLLTLFKGCKSKPLFRGLYIINNAWSGSVYTQAGFVLINTKVPHYGISNNIKGDTQHIIKHAGGKVSYRAYKNNKMISETILS
jgi:hypothetical protein